MKGLLNLAELVSRWLDCRTTHPYMYAKGYVYCTRCGVAFKREYTKLMEGKIKKPLCPFCGCRVREKARERGRKECRRVKPAINPADYGIEVD